MKYLFFIYIDMTWRPTKYDGEYIKKAQKYLKSCKDWIEIVLDKNMTIEKETNWNPTYKEIKTSEVWLPKVSLPSVEWLARYLWIARSTIYLWAESYPEFSDILEEILEEQALRLINNWLAGRYNPNITKLLLIKHWYVDKQEIDNNFKWDFISEKSQKLIDDLALLD